MNINEVRIVADSSADLSGLSGIDFRMAPLKIITAEKEYIDDAALDVRAMVDDLDGYKGKSSTSCPNEYDWLQAYGDAKYIFCVTITGMLSGSYNAARMAKESYEEQHADRKVFVMDSQTAGPEMALIIEKIRDLVLSGADFDEVCERVTKYSKRTGLLFMLESMKNLANNGRVSTLVSKTAGLLGIRVVGKAGDSGDLEPLDKCRGGLKTLNTIVQRLKEQGLKNGRVRITHCFNKEAALALKEQILEKFATVRVEISECCGLCSFYAEKGGLLIGFEKM